MAVDCDSGAYTDSGVTGRDGANTIVFTVPFDVTSCVVTEVTDALVQPVTVTNIVEVFNGGGQHREVAFLNDPIDIPRRTPPSGGTPPPGIPTNTPIPPAPAPPTVEVVVPTATPT